MEVDEQPRNTPFVEGPQKAAITRNLMGWLVSRYGSDLVHVDPLKGFRGVAAPSRAKTSIRVIPMAFVGSAAGFQLAVDNGFPVKMTLSEALSGMSGPPPGSVVKALLPHGLRVSADSPDMHNLGAVFINSVTLAEPLNTTPLPVAIVSSTLPPVYAEMKKKQAKELYEELKQEPPNADILAHIPVSTHGKPDLRQIPVLKEVINAFHATEVCNTFGGIVASDLWNGLHCFSPEEALRLGFARPPPEHDFAAPPVGMMPSYNSWVIVPMGHVLSHVSNLPAASIRECGYVVDRLKMPLTNELLPFLIMDLWTVHAYIRSTIGSVLLNVERNRVSLPDQWIEVVPLTHKRWIDACVAGEEYKTGTVRFKVVITYTTFPVGRHKDVPVLPLLSPGFPYMDIDYKTMVDSDELNKAVAPRKKKAMDIIQRTAPVADANPLTVNKPREAMDTRGDDDGDGGDDDEDGENAEEG